LANIIGELLEYASKISTKIVMASAKTTAYTQIAPIYVEIGQRTKCLELLSLALKASELMKHPHEKASHLAWIARIHEEAGDSVKSRELFTRATLLARASETDRRTAYIE
jgi:hypothetical protein